MVGPVNAQQMLPELRSGLHGDQASRQDVEAVGLAAGSAVGVAIGSVGYAFVEAAFGSIGLHFAILWDLGNLIAGPLV